MKPWLAKTVDGRYTIQKIPCPNPGGPVDLKRPAAGVEHTTEGSWASALSVFKQHYAPHFLVGAHKIAQLVPLGTMAAALENAPGGVETNRWARAQIETVGFSKQHPYSFDAATSDALASLLATLKVEAGIPLRRPYLDALPPQPWAVTSFSRRNDGKWGTTAGWFGHIEVPENEHWDPGALRWAPLLLMANQKLPTKKQQLQNLFSYWHPFGGKWWGA
jgi:N-acetylmuramoyl-L-alanine amidase